MESEYDKLELERLYASLFDLPIADFQDWPRVDEYRRHLYFQYRTIGRQWIQHSLYCADSGDHITFYKCLSFIKEIVDIIRHRSVESQTVDSILRQWFQNQNHDYKQARHKQPKLLYSSIFFILSMITMMVGGTPNGNDHSFELSLPKGYERNPPTQPPNATTRPISIFLRIFGQGPQISDFEETGTEEQVSKLIHITTVNYAILHEFSKVTIE